MFSQFFGHYLLNKGAISTAQMNEALLKRGETRVKLGVLAINAGFMTAEQVDQVHKMQMKVDKRIGDLAVDMGFLTSKQVSDLLGMQKSAHLVLGQTLVDLGHMSNAQLEEALSDYKARYQLDDADFADENSVKANRMATNFLGMPEIENIGYCASYVALLFKSLTRFITDDFTPLAPRCVREISCSSLISQRINGQFSAITGIEGGEDSIAAFASLYEREGSLEPGEYAQAVVSEFLNLHNGLFAVNVSLERDVELSLEPQTVQKDAVMRANVICIVIPISFTFGIVNFSVLPI